MFVEAVVEGDDGQDALEMMAEEFDGAEKKTRERWRQSKWKTAALMAAVGAEAAGGGPSGGEAEGAEAAATGMFDENDDALIAQIVKARDDIMSVRSGGLRRLVCGPKPLIVRAECALDSESIGALAVGGCVQVVETRRTAEGLQAKVLLTAPPMPPPAPLDESGASESAGFGASPRFAFFTPRSITRLPGEPLADPWHVYNDGVGGAGQAPPTTNLSEAAFRYAAQPAPEPACGRRMCMFGHCMCDLAQVSRFTLCVLYMCCNRPRGYYAARSAARAASTAGSSPSSSPIPSRPASPTGYTLAEHIKHQGGGSGGGSGGGDDLATYGWVTAFKNGKKFLSAPHGLLDAGERQRYMALWARRKAADGNLSAFEKQVSKGSGHGAVHAANTEMVAIQHRLSAEECEDGIAFAFGGVEPGVLHAKGHLVKSHTVRYSVGVAGRYRLHVGLRQQGTPLPGSPFLLVISAGNAHAPCTRIRQADLPLRGVIGTEDGDGCSIVLRAADRMGNHCTKGGAKLTLTVGEAQHTKGTDEAGSSRVTTQHVEDVGDGTVSRHHQRVHALTINMGVLSPRRVASPQPRLPLSTASLSPVPA